MPWSSLASSDVLSKACLNEREFFFEGRTLGKRLLYFLPASTRGYNLPKHVWSTEASACETGWISGYTNPPTNLLPQKTSYFHPNTVSGSTCARVILVFNIKPVDPGCACPCMHTLTKKNDSIKIYGLCSIELLMSADLKFSTGLSECLLEWDRVQSWSQCLWGV